MQEIRTSGSMSGEGKRSDAVRPKPPRLSSTLPLQIECDSPDAQQPSYVHCIDCGSSQPFAYFV